MFRNYVKSALRNLKKNKLFAAINALGLSLALAVSFIILLFVINELSYNHCHKNRRQVYKVLTYYVDFKNTFSGTPYPLATALKDEFPQAEKAVRARFVNGFSIKLKDEVINVRGTIATDSEIFDIFTMPFVYGSGGSDLLSDQNSIVLSRELSEKLFPGKNPVGEEVLGMINNAEQLFVVRAVIDDIPENSTFRPKCLVNSRWSLDPINKTFGITNADVSFEHNFWETWIRLPKGCDPRIIEDRLRLFEKKHLGEKPPYQYSLQNLGDVYLGSSNVANAGITGNKSNIRLFTVIALLIVLAAAINYIILSTAVSTGRRTEIGVRKTFGAFNSSIIEQLLGESVLLVLFVLPVSLILSAIALPYAGKLFQTRLNIIDANIPVYIVFYLIITVIIGAVSGLYTSSYMSRVSVMDIFRNSFTPGRRKQFFRSALIVIQLIIFCSFVSGTLIIRSQYNYIVSKDPGFYTNDIIMIDLGRNFKGYTAYINSIKSDPDVIMAAGVMDGLPMMGSMTSMHQHFQDNSLKVKVEGLAVDYNFIKTMGITVLQGREFSQDYGSDMKQSVVLNETAIKQLGITDPLGKLLGDKTIIGVVKDFNLHSLHTDIPPLSITMTDKYINQVAVHYKPGRLEQILPVLETEWKKVAPDRPFGYNTIGSLMQSLYSSEKNLTVIVSVAALFTLLIAAFGLFGLTLFIARSRTRETGIRKVFGSSEWAVIESFLRTNFILVLISSLISIPVTYYFMTGWLKGFAYKTTINPWIFLFTFFVATIVVLSAVFIQSKKASGVNPVEALRNE